MIRRDLEKILSEAAEKRPCITLTGPRQSGKSTLCKNVFSNYTYFNLEDPETQLHASQDPKKFLSGIEGGVIIDEIQKVPVLLSYLQILIDENPIPGKWVITGSHNFALMEGVTQSLAGRTAVLHLLPLSRDEVLRFDNSPKSFEETMFFGSYPRLFQENIQPSVVFRLCGFLFRKRCEVIGWCKRLVIFSKFYENMCWANSTAF